MRRDRISIQSDKDDLTVALFNAGFYLHKKGGVADYGGGTPWVYKKGHVKIKCNFVDTSNWRKYQFAKVETLTNKGGYASLDLRLGYCALEDFISAITKLEAQGPPKITERGKTAPSLPIGHKSFIPVTAFRMVEGSDRILISSDHVVCGIRYVGVVSFDKTNKNLLNDAIDPDSKPFFHLELSVVKVIGTATSGSKSKRDIITDGEVYYGVAERFYSSRGRYAKCAISPNITLTNSDLGMINALLKACIQT